MPVADILETPEPGVVVEAVGGPAVVSHELEHGDDVAVEPCTRTAGHRLVLRVGHHGRRERARPRAVQPVRRRRHRRRHVPHRHRGAGARRAPGRRRARAARASPSRCRTRVLRQQRVATHVHARLGRVVAEQLADLRRHGARRGPDPRRASRCRSARRSPATAWRVPAGTTTNGGIGIAGARRTSPSADARVEVKVRDGRRPDPRTRDGPGAVARRRHHRRDHAGPDRHRLRDRRDRGRRRRPARARWSPSCWRRGRRRRRRRALPSTAGHVARRPPLGRAAARASTPTAFVTVFNPGPEPVTAEVLPADFVDRRRGPTSEPELAIAPGKAKVLRLVLARDRPGGALVVTAHAPGRGRVHAARRRRCRRSARRSPIPRTRG